MSSPERILVAYGSKHGATAEIAEAIGAALSRAGFDVDVERGRRVGSLEPYRAVVLGSAVYAGRWRPEALRLLRRSELRDHDVWVFSSGPVGADARDPVAAERFTRPPLVQRLADTAGAHDHAVFGGMVADDAGFIRSKMARGMPPELRDRRDWDEIAAWAESIATALTDAPVPVGIGA